MSLPRLRSHLKMLAPSLRKFGNPDFFKKHPNEYFLTRPRLVKIKIPFLNSAIGSQQKIQTSIWVVRKGCFRVKTAKSVFEANITSTCLRARYTLPRTYARSRDRATYVRTYGRYTHARVRTRARESSDFKGEFNYYPLRLKVFLKDSCKFSTYIELRILILKYKI